MAVTAESVARAIRKAQRVQPTVLALSGEMYCVASSKPGQGYLVMTDGVTVTCTCVGFEHFSVCYHSAAVLLETGMIDPPAEDFDIRREMVVTPARRRSEIFEEAA